MTPLEKAKELAATYHGIKVSVKKNGDPLPSGNPTLRIRPRKTAITGLQSQIKYSKSQEEKTWLKEVLIELKKLPDDDIETPWPVD